MRVFRCIKAGRQALPPAIGVLWCVFFIHINFSWELPPREDDPFYLVLAKSFAQGDGYRDISSPAGGNLLTVPSAFPLLVSGYWRLGAPGIGLLKLGMACLLAAGMAAAYLFLRKLVPPWLALALTLAFSANEIFLMLSDAVLTELLFLPVFYLACTLALSEPAVKKAGGREWGALALWLLLARVRFVGLFFFAAHLARLAAKRRWGQLGAGIAGLSLWLGFERLMVMPAHSKYGYVDSFFRRHPFFENPMEAALALWEAAAHNVAAFGGGMYARILFPFAYHAHPMDIFKRGLVVAVFLVGCWGFVLFWNRHPRLRPVLLAFLAQSALLLTWPRTQTLLRYFYPFFPLLALFFLYPLERLAYWARRPMLRRFAIPGLAALMVGDQAIHSLRLDTWNRWKISSPQFRALHADIASSPRPPSVLFSPVRYYTYLHAGIPSLPLQDLRHAFDDPELAEGNGAWIVLHAEADGDVRDSLPRDPVPHLDTLKRTPDGWLLLALSRREAAAPMGMDGAGMDGAGYQAPSAADTLSSSSSVR